MAKAISLALQGGGAHGAFTWGVLDRLLEAQAIDPRAVSGTSAGALNAAALVSGLCQGGHDGARQALERLWRLTARRSPLGAAERMNPFVPDAFMGAWLEGAKVLGQLFSPYRSSLPTANLLRHVIEEAIDFQRLRDPAAIPLFVGATDVKSGRARVFAGSDVTAEALLASACLPNLFRAVEIDGRSYWDGGYMGNPVLSPLYSDACDAEDLLIVQVTPFSTDLVPERQADIMNRVNEITFNSSLMRDLRTVRNIQRLARDEDFSDATLRRIAKLRIHMIVAGPELSEGGSAGKLDTRFSSLSRLRDLGRASASRWLEESFEDVGSKSTATSTVDGFSVA